MSSVRCANCGLVNWATEENCKRCGSPIQSVVNLSNSLKLASKGIDLEVEDFSYQGEVTSANCPECHSVETRSFKMIYESGTSRGTLAAASYNPHTGGTVTGGIISQQSRLAASVAPPSSPRGNGDGRVLMYVMACLFAFSIGTVIAAILTLVIPMDIAKFIGGAITLGLSAFGVVEAKKGSGEEYKGEFRAFLEAYRDWSRCWMCLRCGHTWKR